ncbi:hypothetical protein H5410_058650 [Solanum commersonii]|uniref:Uncharacterized protein n=1 Tax=Solanum commersonii TaxID=4109 RepID=A0A9J5WTS3_SOLCO|nr:hypothetical protein H5410_058650 [Solanum commersonii]
MCPSLYHHLPRDTNFANGEYASTCLCKGADRLRIALTLNIWVHDHFIWFASCQKKPVAFVHLPAIVFGQGTHDSPLESMMLYHVQGLVGRLYAISHGLVRGVVFASFENTY